MKRYLNIALILLVVGIYGAIAWKYLRSDTTSTQLEIASAPPIHKEFSKSTPPEASPAIELIERDPFLDRMQKVALPSPSKETADQKRKPSKRQARQPKIHSRPTIQYLGFMTKSGESEPTALLRINGVLVRKKENDSYNGIKIVSVYGDSVALTFENSKRFMLYKTKQ